MGIVNEVLGDFPKYVQMVSKLRNKSRPKGSEYLTLGPGLELAKPIYSTTSKF